MRTKEKYIILCPTFKRVIYKSVGITLLLLMALSYALIPTFWNDKEHISMPIFYACLWMITRAGFVKKEVGYEKN